MNDKTGLSNKFNKENEIKKRGRNNIILNIKIDFFIIITILNTL